MSAKPRSAAVLRAAAGRLLRMWMLGVVSLPTLILCALVLFLTVSGYGHGLWLLLWLPIYATVLITGHRRLKRLEGVRLGQIVRKRAQEWESADEHARLEQTLDVLEDTAVRAEVDARLKGVGVLNVALREEWQCVVISSEADKVAKGTLTPAQRAILHPAGPLKPYPGLVFWGRGLSAAARYPLVDGGKGGVDRVGAVRVRRFGSKSLLSVSEAMVEQGFPMEAASDAEAPDPRYATTSSFGIVMPDRNRSTRLGSVYVAVDTKFFAHRVVLDDRGSVLWLALDDKPLGKSWGTPLFVQPAGVERLLGQLFRDDRSRPVVWCCTSAVPFSEAAVPLVELPIPTAALSTLWVDPFTPARPYVLLVPRRGVDFNELVARLQALWEATLDREGQGQLLLFLRNDLALARYLQDKRDVLGEYFLVHEGSLGEKERDPRQAEVALQQKEPVPQGHRTPNASRRREPPPKRLAQLARFHTSNPQRRRRAWIARLIGAGVGLPIALASGATTLGAIHMVVLSACVADGMIRSWDAAAHGLQEAIVAMRRRALSFAVLAGCLYLLVNRTVAGLPVAATWGLVFGSHDGFRRWWKRKVPEVLRLTWRETPPDEYPVYRNEEHRFSMSYPPGLTPRQAPKLAVLFQMPDRAQLNVTVGKYTAPPSLAEYLEGVKRTVGGYLVSGDYIEKAEGIDLPPGKLQAFGVPYAARVIYMRRIGSRSVFRRRDINWRFMKFSFPRGGHEYVFTYRAPAERFAWYREVIQRCLDSLEFGV